MKGAINPSGSKGRAEQTRYGSLGVIIMFRHCTIMSKDEKCLILDPISHLKKQFLHFQKYNPHSYWLGPEVPLVFFEEARVNLSPIYVC